MKTIALSLTIMAMSCNINSQTPTKKQLFAELKKQNVIDPVAAYRISMLETGHLKSKMATENHNLFGLKRSGKYMKFKNWKECVKYFANLECNKWDKYGVGGNYYDFVAWWGYKSGYSCGKSDVKYSQYLKKITCEFN